MLNSSIRLTTKKTQSFCTTGPFGREFNTVSFDLKFLGIRLLVQQLVEARNKENIKIQHCLFLRGIHKGPEQSPHRMILRVDLRQLDCLLNSFLMLILKKTPKLHWPFLWGKPLLVGSFFSGWVSNAKSNSMSFIWSWNVTYSNLILLLWYSFGVVENIFSLLNVLGFCVNFTTVMKFSSSPWFHFDFIFYGRGATHLLPTKYDFVKHQNDYHLKFH